MLWRLSFVENRLKMDLRVLVLCEMISLLMTYIWQATSTTLHCKLKESATFAACRKDTLAALLRHIPPAPNRYPSCVVDSGIQLWPFPQQIDVDILPETAIHDEVLELSSLELQADEDRYRRLVNSRFCPRVKQLMERKEWKHMVKRRRLVDRDKPQHGLWFQEESMLVLINEADREICERYEAGYYQLEYSRKGRVDFDRSGSEESLVVIKGCGREGVQYALETFTQIVAQLNARIMSIRITDWPRFSWRGLMLDTSR